ncbi:hypothetical protein A0H81_10082 [Grifola frondosa]|uniref:Uncharacterized protein n=1 Tax=Grifola frondosa TaxID=5627 RepID=A0A1C7LYR3_GRIFR|nr:hypothetical protein A0H81_10082 [Grifola frondosa]
MRGLAITRRATSPQLIPLGREEDAGTTRQVWYSACSANLHIVEGLRLHSEHHPQPLPPTFTSLYRLFLRTTSASVALSPPHHAPASQVVETHFVGAAQMIRRLQNEQLGDDQREMLICWYEEWQRRMDNTLSLQVASAKSRDLSSNPLCGLVRVSIIGTKKGPSG